MINTLGKTAIFSILGYLRGPKIELDQDKVAVFDQLMADHELAPQSIPTLQYKAPYPKCEFLHYLTTKRRFLLHGSFESDINIFEPRNQTTFYGKQVRAVFATPDAIWPIFFAILNRDLLKQYRNGCFSTGATFRSHYFFSVPKGMRSLRPWKNGTVYVFHRQSFQQSDTPNEWISFEPVTPIAKISVSPDDFPFLNQVTEYDPKLSMTKFFMLQMFRRLQ